MKNLLIQTRPLFSFVFFTTLNMFEFTYNHILFNIDLPLTSYVVLYLPTAKIAETETA